MMTLKKWTVLGLAAAMLVTGASGCSKKNEESDGKVTISIANWPTETSPESLKKMEGYLTQFNEQYPDVNVVRDTGDYADAKAFTMKAAANQLPTMYGTHFTEIQKIIKSGYAADITDVLKERGLYDAMNPDFRKFCEGGDGRVYAIANSAYAMGLNINKALFREAGLVNEDGTAMIPDTYEQLAEYAKIIKDKTGQAGFEICTTNNCGGWHFMNIAWSYGVQFMKQRDDGTWEATFDTPECVAALQYIKDLKWKYDVLPADKVIDQPTAHKLFAVGQAAMFFDAPKTDLSKKYGMNSSDYAMARMPAGPAGRYAQTGGSVWMFSPTATKEQLNACIDWINITGFSKDLDDAAYANKEKSYQTSLEENNIILPKEAFSLWSDPERIAKENELRSKYTNVDEKDYASYFESKDVTLHAEEPIACQQLYAVLDGCIQEVITNKDADPAALIATACKDFQANHLDKQ